MADVLVFGAHPDDAEFGMGGTLLTMKAQGLSIALCVLTKGESGTHGNPQLRTQEMKDAAAFLGADIEMLDFVDCEVHDTPQARKEIAAVIRKYKPKLVFAPWYNNPGSHLSGSAHPDHIATGQLVRAATRFARFTNAQGITGDAHRASHVLYYMLGAHEQPTCFVDVTDHMKSFEELCAKHASQLAIADGKVLEYLVARRQSVMRKDRYTEGFISPDPLPINFSLLLE